MKWVQRLIERCWLGHDYEANVVDPRSRRVICVCRRCGYTKDSF